MIPLLVVQFDSSVPVAIGLGLATILATSSFMIGVTAARVGVMLAAG
jgi:hypothetical protein